MDESKEPEVIEGEMLEVISDDSTINAITLQPALSVMEAVDRYAMMRSFVSNVMEEGIDYGTIPGTAKPTLYKPGSEKLTRFFGLSVDLQLADKVERWDATDPFFFYRYSADLYRHGILIARAYGSANSMEDRYHWRWVVHHKLPKTMTPKEIDRLEVRTSVISEFDFAVEKAETTGQYGKPEAYWQSFRAAIEDGTARAYEREARSGTSYPAWEISTTTYRIPNPEIFTLVNTLDKMAQKRALVAGTLIACGASEFFTQDLEDIGPQGNGGPETVTQSLKRKHDAEAQDIRDKQAERSPAEQKEASNKGSDLLYGAETDERELLLRFKTTFDARLIEHKGHKKNEALRTRVIVPLVKIFEGLAEEADNHRHAAQDFLTGKASFTKWTGAEMLALLRCLGVDEKTLAISPSAHRAMRLAARAKLEA